MKKRFLMLLMASTVNITAHTNIFFEQVQNSRVQTVHHQSNNYNPQQSNQFLAKKFFYAQRAAKHGNPKAQFDLAIMYATGQGVQKNERIAFNLFHKAARNHNIEAKYYMGLSFLQGRGVRQQLDLARYWFKLAAKQGHVKARQYLSQIERSSGYSM